MRRRGFILIELLVVIAYRRKPRHLLFRKLLCPFGLRDSIHLRWAKG
jgi:hypothetical protein